MKFTMVNSDFWFSNGGRPPYWILNPDFSAYIVPEPRCIIFQLLSKSINWLRGYYKFTIFHECGRPSSWIFNISKHYWPTGLEAEMYHMPIKFRQNPFNPFNFSIFQYGSRPPSWVHKIFKFYYLSRSRGPKCIIVPNFVKNRQAVFEILRFLDFLRWRPPLSWIFKISKFYYFSGSWMPKCIMC